ncbi:methionine adenosyltransferase 2 subunit beta isoform X2 [Maylandia zebra]|uniref:Methionine adenosyltransferase 2 subunit beta n=1 Tax=Pundamilia nyererei TaxID=303518 RepID=A0A9Y3S9M9_9CICH|nr:PREDICTED: methionine adenosyltransferase 2 subunit beta isoform X2 [Pundamilia nyererei]XP_024657506.1 methionine adenosyltransferase 2 subunit beta isoform X1 [Maylandia zebra]XP_042070956.1 methionine adenosyltransferase 2 subunit beta isoform X3 [Haplochromis burtoni]
MRKSNMTMFWSDIRDVICIATRSNEELLVGAPRVLVTGATGLLGRAVCREFHSAGWTVTGTGYRRARLRLLRCDLTDEDAVRGLLHEYKPDVIVHCAAERRPDVMERHTEAAVNLNVHATSTLAKEAATCGALFLYISTDYVFDGRNPPYGEDDSPNPLNVYGRSKLEGERETLRHCPGAVVLRVPVLFGEVESVTESVVTSLYLKVQEASEESCTLDHVLQRFPTDARDVAAVCRKLSERARQDPSIRGIFHFSGKEQMTKYEMAVAIAQAFNLPSGHLIPLTEQPAASALRPINSQLNCCRLELLNLSVEPRPFTSAIIDCLWPFTPDKRWRQTVFH